MKVCQLCSVDFTLQHFLLPLIDGMRSEGWDVTAVCADGEYVGDLRKKGYDIHTINFARSYNVFAHIRALWDLYKYFRVQKFHVLHVHTPIAALIGRLAGWAAGIPYIVYTAHGFYFHDQMPKWKYRIFVALERFAGAFTDLLFTQSSEDAATATAEGIARHEDVVAIGNGVNADRFNPSHVCDSQSAKKSLGISCDAPVIGIIGRLVREKGYNEFLRSAIALHAEFPDAYFLVVGGRLKSDHDDPIESALDAARLVLKDKLVLAGFQSDMPRMLAAMDVFCLPSYREGMPRTIIEAMMMAKPVVATDIRGAREEVVDGVTGLLVAARDPASLAAALRRYLHSPDEGRKMGMEGRRRALEFYDEKRVVEFQIKEIRARLESK